jgi:hypothetical protein
MSAPPFTDLAALARESAIQALGGTDAPIGRADELVAAVTGEGLKAVIQARVRQLVRGHGAETDDMLPIGWLPMEARHCFERARDRLNEGELGDARRLLAEGAAYGLAAIDRLDRAMLTGGR